MSESEEGGATVPQAKVVDRNDVYEPNRELTGRHKQHYENIRKALGCTIHHGFPILVLGLLSAWTYYLKSIALRAAIFSQAITGIIANAVSTVFFSDRRDNYSKIKVVIHAVMVVINLCIAIVTAHIGEAQTVLTIACSICNMSSTLILHSILHLKGTQIADFCDRTAERAVRKWCDFFENRPMAQVQIIPSSTELPDLTA